MFGMSLSASGNKVRAVALTAAIGLGAIACDSAMEPQTSHVRVLLTDAPSDMLDSAHVWISHVYLQGGGGEEPDTAAADSLPAGGRVDLFEDAENPLVFDLLQLRNGITADLTGLVEIPAGMYQGLRFVVDSARVTLAEGFAFQDGSTVGVLQVPSGSRSGIKVKLDDVLRAGDGEAMTITVDFDVDQNFVIQTNGPGGSVKAILFTPMLKEKSREEGGEAS